MICARKQMSKVILKQLEYYLDFLAGKSDDRTKSGKNLLICNLFWGHKNFKNLIDITKLGIFVRLSF